MAHRILLIAVCVALVLIAGFVSVRSSEKYRGAALILTFATFLAGLGVVVWVWNRVDEEPHPDAIAAEDNEPLFPKPAGSGFAGSDSCRECHADQFQSWHKSYHRTMTQPARADTVLAPFDAIELETDGLTASLSRKGGEFRVEAFDPGWERAVFLQGGDAREAVFPERLNAKVVMTTGSHHFQAYWIKNQDTGELLQFPWRYHLQERRWVHRKDVFLGPPEFRPGMHFRLWNSDCIFCHSTGGQPGFDPATGSMKHTKVAELGISCEACHGPAEKHVAAMKSKTSPADDPLIVNPRTLPHRLASQVCGRCHSHFHHTSDDAVVTGLTYQPGEELGDHIEFITPADPHAVSSRYWSDGNCRSGGREFSGLAASKCFQDGELSCLSCHSLHNSDPDDQLAAGMETNQACYQCHAEYEINVSKHTHHPPDSAGSHCYNCHMPHTSYALFKAIRSHRVDSPRVTPVGHNQRPNACNLCHLDQTLDWTNRRLSTWYGIPRAELTEEESHVASGVLWLLRGDSGQRAIAAWHAGWEPALKASGSGWIAPILSQLLDDPYSAVRWVAYRSLCRLPGFEEFGYDFDGPASNRTADAERARKIWRALKKMPDAGRSESASSRLLLNAQGDLDLSRLKEILGRRDDKPLAIVE